MFAWLAAHALATPIVVDAGGGGDYTDLAEAIESNWYGDVEIEVRAGTYEVVDGDWVGQNLTLSGEGEDVVTVSTSGYGMLYATARTSSEFSGFSIVSDDGADAYGLFVDDGEPYVHDMRFNGLEESVLFKNVDQATVETSRFEDMLDVGVTFQSSGPIYIENNVFVGGAWGLCHYAAILYEAMTPVYARANTFIGNEVAVAVFWPNDVVLLEDNLFVGATQDAIAVQYDLWDPSNTRNNLFWDNTETYEGELHWGSDYLEADPRFVDWSDDGDPTNDDLHLAGGSGAIDGALGGVVLYDADGETREYDGDFDGTAAGDLGAYEYVGDADWDDDGVEVPTDCDDAHADAYPGGTEVWYDGVDQDCAGDDDYDRDLDGYLYGDDDCDDDDASVYPGAADAWYDGVDSDCASNSDWDADADGWELAEDCDDTDPTVHPRAADAWYDDLDADCAGDDDFDADADGYTVDVDCDDTAFRVHPGAYDAAYDGVDADCAGDDDDDADADGSPRSYDCDDTDPEIGILCPEPADTGDTAAAEPPDARCGCGDGRAAGMLLLPFLFRRRPSRGRAARRHLPERSSPTSG